jgi:hypothetical protein
VASGVVVQDTNQCAGIKIQLPGRTITSMNFRSATKGVSLMVRFAGKHPSQVAGNDDSQFSGIIVNTISPSTGKKQVQVANVFLSPTFPAQQ